MKIKIYNPKDLNKKYRVSVHKTGRIGFPSDAADKLKLAENKSADFGENEDDPNDNSLYMVVYKEKEKGGFKVNKNGDYYSINLKILLDNLNIDYSNGTVWFEMEEKIINEEKIYRMEKKGKVLKNNNEDETVKE
jgi:hypothetical protein